MDNGKILQAIKEDLEKEGLDCLIPSFDPDLPAKLLIYSGEDKENRSQLIEITAESAKINQSNTLVSLRLDAFFPFTVDDLALIDTAQFLHFLNLQVEIPGFCLNHADNTILYRYILLCENGHVPKQILLSLIGIAMFFQDAFGQTLERLGKNETTFLELINELKNVFEKGAEPSNK